MSAAVAAVGRTFTIDVEARIECTMPRRAKKAMRSCRARKTASIPEHIVDQADWEPKRELVRGDTGVGSLRLAGARIEVIFQRRARAACALSR